MPSPVQPHRRTCHERPRNPQSIMLAFVNLDERVPPDHPLRIIKRVADDALGRMSDDFYNMYSSIGRASVPPERLLKSLLLISLYSIRSERAFCPRSSTTTCSIAGSSTWT